MAITLNYLPAAGLVGDAAYQTGLAEALRQKQAEDFARQQRDAALAEERRQFDITNQRQYDQFAESQYQFDAGQALQDQRLAEGQRQFDAEQALREQQLGDARKSEEFNRQIADHRDRLARYGIMQQSADRQAAVAGQLAEVDLRGQYALAADQNDLLREGMRQQGETQRASDATQGRFGMQWQAQAAKQMQADWQNIQKVLPRLDPSEREELIAQFQQKWESANIPMPVELPAQEIPEWMDPNAQWERARSWQQQQQEMGNHILLIPDENGMPSIPRGWPQFSQTPQGIQQQNDAKIKQAEIAHQNKVADAEVKKQEAWDKSQLDKMDAEMKAAQAEDAHAQSVRHAEDLHYQQMQAKLADMQLKIATAKSKPTGFDKEGNASPPVDTSAMETTVNEYQAEIAKYKAKRAAEASAADPIGEMQSWAGGGQQPEQPVAPPQGGAVTVWSNSDLQAALSNPKIPAGTSIIWGPTGKSRAK